jgi:L-aspartate oxidase
MTGVALRRLPPARTDWEIGADVVVVGSGAAGITAALTAAHAGRRVLLLSKEDLGGGSTPLAQGGLAAAIGPDDDPARHRRDTLEAGAGLCDPVSVAALAAEAPGEIARLAGRGARLNRTALHREGGHSRPRIVHAGGDAVGAEVHRVLLAAVTASPVEILTGCAVLDALTDGQGSVGGVLAGMAADDGSLWTGIVTARAVVLATGGFGQAYATTTNPAGVTGDGLALAARAGATLQDLEFVQFHPTVLWQQAARGQCPLITEALRGAGAVLVDAAGRPVMAGRHPLGDLAPRDVVSAAMQQRMACGDGPDDHLWLDATALGRAALERDFPTVTAACRARGIDPSAEPIPVAPGAHYACGGIRADMAGRTSVTGLYAVGEAASTGVHGANRLASNSLTEALITGRRAGELLARELPGPPASLRLPPAGPGVDPAVRPALAAAMSRDAGVMRDRAGVQRLRQLLGQLPPAAREHAAREPAAREPAAREPAARELAGRGPAGQGPAPRGAAAGRLDLATAEATNLHAVSVLVAVSALARAESRGCHRWRDTPPVTSAERARHTVVRVDADHLRPAAAVEAGAGAAA